MTPLEVDLAEIVLATVNARYAHTAFGLRYLMANLGPLAARAELLELDGRKNAEALALELVSTAPRVVGLGVYVWNVTLLTAVAGHLKRLRPDVILVLGGPEVSYETEGQSIVAVADYVVTGEADLVFAELVNSLLAGQRPATKVLAAPLPSLDANEGGVRLPYHLYTDVDLAHRVVYVEASRGCPFACDFCLSAVVPGVRRFPLTAFFAAMEGLLARGARRFKFVDRTFNLDDVWASSVLEWFLGRLSPELRLHFEIVPDRLSEGLRRLIARFPAEVLHLEVGVQSLNDEVCARIHRRQEGATVEANLRFLREQSGATVHADLVLGLPGEELQSIAQSFDRLVALRPHELQVGVLKRLRGAPLSQHDEPFAMQYNPTPPYEVVRTSTLEPAVVERLKRLARYWDLLSHSGFHESRAAVCRGRSAFAAFLAFSDWLFGRCGRTYGLPLTDVADLLVEYLETQGGLTPAAALALVTVDYQRPGRRDWPRQKR